jgi:thiosulfate reductase cytochrome b subunit
VTVLEHALAAPGEKVKVHPWPVRLAHWVNVIAMLIMVTSGWRIYNASPLFDFQFLDWITLGGWLAGALQWHFAAMWLLVANGLFYLLHGIFSGHYRRDFLPVSVRSVANELRNALRGRLSHELGIYNALQRVAYLAVIVVGILIVASGLAMWKPVQFQEIASLMGGYEGARLVHFFSMATLVLFAIVHVVMVLIVPRTFLPMITGRARGEQANEEGRPA